MMKNGGLTVRCILRLFALVLLTLNTSLALAELRVIIEYDSNEHRLMRLVELAASNSMPLSDHLQANSGEDSNSQVKLRWFNADGALVGTGSIADPRVTHLPLTGADQAPTVVGLSTGAYVVTGPLESTLLEIQLPASISLGLGVQIWRIALDR